MKTLPRFSSAHWIEIKILNMANKPFLSVPPIFSTTSSCFVQLPSHFSALFSNHNNGLQNFLNLHTLSLYYYSQSPSPTPNSTHPLSQNLTISSSGKLSLKFPELLWCHCESPRSRKEHIPFPKPFYLEHLSVSENQPFQESIR